jgi:uncharacterized protein (TIGR02246 family)
MSADLQALKQEAARRLAEWATTGCGLVSSSLYDACAWFSTGLADHHSHDAQIGFIPCGYTAELWHSHLNVDTALYFDDASNRLAPDAECMIVLANPVLPHSEGEIVLESADPTIHPAIRMNYFGDAHDMKVMLAVLRRTLEVVAHWPSHRTIGPLMVPPFLAQKHGYREGATPSDALLEDLALHFSLTVYHLTSTCRIGSVVDPRLRVAGVGKLRVADASVMPNVVSGNTNAASIMIGEKAAEMVAADYGVKLAAFVGEPGSRLQDLATKYTAAWCSQNAASVAAFFAEDGSLTINDGPPSVGRTAISEAAQDFMTAFPDMVVTMDGIALDGDCAVYRWTLTGKHTGPGGTGKAVHISGYEEWTIDSNGLIAQSKGHFDEAAYQRQLNTGIGESWPRPG